MLSSYTKLSPTQPKVFIPKCSFSLFTNLIYLPASHCLPNKENVSHTWFQSSKQCRCLPFESLLNEPSAKGLKYPIGQLSLLHSTYYYRPSPASLSFIFVLFKQFTD